MKWHFENVENPCGMSHNRIVGPYVSLSNAIRYGAKGLKGAYRVHKLNPHNIYAEPIATYTAEL
jgi:hypothetical protein